MEQQELWGVVEQEAEDLVTLLRTVVTVVTPPLLDCMVLVVVLEVLLSSLRDAR